MKKTTLKYSVIIAILSILSKLKIFPNPIFIIKPHKIFEFEQIIKLVNIQKEDIVLDIGCGMGIQTLLIGKKCKQIIGLDISKEAINWANILSAICSSQINSEFICKTLETVKFPTNSFDEVFSICFLEHIFNYNEILAEIYRILKPSGSLVISVDALTPIKSPELLKKHKKDHRVKNYFTVKQLNKILKSNGFKDVFVLPILKSEYAIKNFLQGINSGFKKQLDFSLTYIKILINEAKSKNKEGIFLIAKCKK